MHNGNANILANYILLRRQMQTTNLEKDLGVYIRVTLSSPRSA
jgi:hypothetical protein